jgi:hypothetical protein
MQPPGEGIISLLSSDEVVNCYTQNLLEVLQGSLQL